MELEELVSLAQAGQPEAYREVCLRFEGLVHKLALRPHLAAIREEAIAEGRLAVATAVVSFSPAAGIRFAGYVDSRVTYAMWNLFKRERRRWEHERSYRLPGQQDEECGEDYLLLLADPQDIERYIMDQEEQCCLRSALSELPERQRIVLRRLYGEDARLAEVAAELGISVQAVHGLEKRGLARLKTCCAGMYSSVRR